MAKPRTQTPQVDVSRFAVGTFLTDGTALYQVVGTRGELRMDATTVVPLEALLEDSASYATRWVDTQDMLELRIVRPANLTAA
mgnify:CR=1 FL=1